jgi:hypothetical protein
MATVWQSYRRPNCPIVATRRQFMDGPQQLAWWKVRLRFEDTSIFGVAARFPLVLRCPRPTMQRTPPGRECVPNGTVFRLPELQEHTPGKRLLRD